MKTHPWFCTRTLTIDNTHDFEVKISIPYSTKSEFPNRSWTCDILFSGYEFDFGDSSGANARTDRLLKSRLFEQTPFAAFQMALCTTRSALHSLSDRISWLGRYPIEAAFPKDLPDPYYLEKYTAIADECISLLDNDPPSYPAIDLGDSQEFSSEKASSLLTITEEIQTRFGSPLRITLAQPFEITPHSWGCVMNIEGLGYSSYLHRLNERPCGYDSIDAVISRLDLLSELLEPHLLRIARNNEISPNFYFMKRCPSFLSRSSLDNLLVRLEELRASLLDQDY